MADRKAAMKQAEAEPEVVPLDGLQTVESEVPRAACGSSRN